MIPPHAFDAWLNATQIFKVAEIERFDGVAEWLPFMGPLGECSHDEERPKLPNEKKFDIFNEDHGRLKAGSA